MFNSKYLPRMEIKPGASLRGIRPEMVAAFPAICAAYARYAVPAVMTAGTDGSHSRGSLHYVGLATDWRTKNLPGGSAGLKSNAVAADIRKALGEEFDVVLEKTHIHIEYQPKEAQNA